MPVADAIAARMTQVAAAVEAPSAGEEEAASEPAEGAIPTGDPAETTEGEAPVAPAEQAAPPPEENEATKAQAAKRALLEARLAEVTERRKAQRLNERAREAARAAEADRQAAAEVRAKFDALKQGNFKEGLAALGRDPRQVFEEMQREAIEANTPEAEIKRLRADFERQMGEKLEPLQKTIEQLQRERAVLAARDHDAQLQTAFMAEVQDPEFLSLRTEYDDVDLVGYVKHFDQNPEAFHASAKQYGVQLTNPNRGFTMREILTVLKAAQDAHDQGRQQRAARLQATTAPAAPSAKTPTVNGTAPRGNAGTTIGNDLAGERASTGRRLSRQERIEAEIARLEKR
jgi:hypothetical protein